MCNRIGLIGQSCAIDLDLKVNHGRYTCRQRSINLCAIVVRKSTSSNYWNFADVNRANSQLAKGKANSRLSFQSARQLDKQTEKDRQADRQTDRYTDKQGKKEKQSASIQEIQWKTIFSISQTDRQTDR